MIDQILYAVIGFAALFVVSAAMVYWRGRRARRDRRYWNSPHRP
ncbi:hypothetical protein [Paraburkholderia atlantica]